jgi:hypothetical protein
MRSATTAASAIALLLQVTPALALAPLAPAFQVNTTTTGDQGYGGYTSCGYWKQRQHGIGSGGGQFVVVWESRNYPEYGVFGQRYDATATPLGGEFEVHTSSMGTQTMPVVAQAASGQFVVAWGSSQFYGYPMDIFARAFDSSGTPLGPAFQVSENGYDLGGYPAYHYGKTDNPAIEADASGKFVVVWAREDASADGKDVMGRRLDASGTPLAGAFQVSELTGLTDTFYWNRTPDVAVKGTGEFVVVWSGIPNNLGGYAVVGRRYDAAGAALGGEFQVNAQPTYSYNGMTYPIPSYFESSPEARFGNDDFLVLWSSSSIDAEGQNGPYDVAGRFFTGGGAPKGGAFRVNTTTSGYQGCPSTDRLDDGKFVVTWRGDADGTRGYGQVITPSGSKDGVEFQLTTDEASYPGFAGNVPVVAALGSEFVVAWSEYHDGTYWDVYAQRIGEGTGPAATCTPAPMTNCFDAGAFKKSSLTYSRRGGDPAKSRLRWRWKGEATTQQDFGNPKFGTGYAFCLYDTSGAPQPLMQAQIHASGQCTNRPCWQDLGSNLGISVQYYNGDGNDDGVVRMRLSPGSANRNNVSVQGKGAGLDLPAAPLTFPTITAQAQATNGKCWSAQFGSFIKKNETDSFSARSN